MPQPNTCTELRLAALCGCNLAVVPGHPAHLATNLHDMPAVESSSDMVELRIASDGSDTGIICPISHTDVEHTAVADELHPCRGHLLRFRFLFYALEYGSEILFQPPPIYNF